MRRKKDYSIPPSNSALRETNLDDVSPFKLHFTDGQGQLIQTFDFSEFAKRPLLAKYFLEAFRETQTINKPITRKANFGKLRLLFRFLDTASAQVTNVKDISTELIKEFVDWISKRDWSLKTKHHVYHCVKPLLVWLRQKHNLSDLELVNNPFPDVNRSTRPQKILDESELAAVLRAARAEIKRTWATYQKGQLLLADYIPSEEDRGEPDLSDLSALLWHIKTKFGGVLPSISLLTRRKVNYLTSAVSANGGAEQICRYLHATTESLTAYKIVIAAETFGNAGAVHHFKRNCSSAHPLLSNRTILAWEKGRSNRVQRRSFDHRKDSSVPKLIDQVLAMTEPLVPHASPAERQYLFLSRTRGADGYIKVGLPTLDVNTRHLEAFCRRNDLRNSQGELLSLNLSMLRPTGLTLAYRNLGGDILAVQKLANHASARTTALYIVGPEVAKDNDAHIAKLQAQWVDTITGGGLAPEELKRKVEVDDTNAEAILAGRNATASGFVCKDPYAGVMTGQRKGQLCIAWLGCFVCPNAVIPMEARYLAKIFQVRDHLLAGRLSLNPDRWRLLYAPIVQIIELDICPRFTNPWVIEEAKEMAKTLPPLPPLS